MAGFLLAAGITGTAFLLALLSRLLRMLITRLLLTQEPVLAEWGGWVTGLLLRLMFVVTGEAVLLFSDYSQEWQAKQKAVYAVLYFLPFLGELILDLFVTLKRINREER